jgi:hypothetical protein
MMIRFGCWLALAVLILMAGCAGSRDRVETVSPVLPEAPRLDLPPDQQMVRVIWVIEKFGTRTVKHGTYSEYQKARGKTGESAFNPDIFYDRYLLDLNEKNFWMTVTLRSAKQSMGHDARIRDAMKGFPREVIDVIIKTPDEKTYLLSDSDADGVLDFTARADERGKVRTAGDLSLLKNMQVKYQWILGIIKRHYRL